MSHCSPELVRAQVHATAADGADSLKTVQPALNGAAGGSPSELIETSPEISDPAT